MAVTITRTQVRQEMLRRAPILGRALTADSLAKAGTTLTHIAEYERQRAGLTSFENQYVHRYNLADPDRWRLITALNSGASDGVINVDGPAWANNTDLAYERLTLHPDDLNFAIAEGQRRQRTRTNIALVRGHDMDMELAGVDYWGGGAALGNSVTSNIIPTKITTDVHSGTQALHCVSTGGGGIRGETISVTPNSQVYVAIIARVTAGGLSFNLFDYTNTVTFGDTRTWSGVNGDWVLMAIQASIPAGCYQIQVELDNTTVSSVFDIDTCFGPYQAGQTEYNIQSAFNEAYKLRYVRPATYISVTTTQGVFNAEAMKWDGDLTTPEDWSLQTFRRDVNSNRLHFVANSYNAGNIGWTAWGGMGPSSGIFMQSNMRPIWLAMEAQVSDFEPLLTETSTTTQPLDECVCYSLRWLAETATQRDPSNPIWQAMLQEYKAWAVIEDMARPPQPMYRPVRLHQIRI